MKVLRLLPRSALLLTAAMAFVGLIQIYGEHAQVSLPNSRQQAARRNYSDAPNAGQFPEFVGGIVQVAIYALAGRLVFRLRLSSVPRAIERPIALNLHT